MAGKIFYRINYNIRAPSLRVIDQDGKQLGVLPRVDALKKAQDEGIDLVEVAPNASPPVARLIDFKKFLYLEEKKKRKQKKAKGGETKGIRLTPFIAEGDLRVRLKRAEEFLREGNKIRAEIRFKGRQLVRRDIGYQLFRKFAENLASYAEVEQEPKWFGRNLVGMLTPVKRKKVEKNVSEEEKETKNEEITRPPVQDNENR